MNYKEIKQSIAEYSSRNLEERKNWYSPAAKAYNKFRPRYPQELINQVIDIASLSSNSQILEVGCGPGTATLAFTELGAKIICLEPNLDFYKLARQNCQQYSQIVLQNKSFEEWNLEVEKFDAVLAATSFHWIPSDIGYPKAAKVLRDDGHLILLWNKQLQPSYEVYQCLAKIYQAHAPSLDKYEDKVTQEKILQGLGEIVLDSRLFKNLVFGYIDTELTYTVDEYLSLLNTYSPYLKLASKTKQALFQGLRNKIESNFGGSLKLSYISAFHIAQKC